MNLSKKEKDRAELQLFLDRFEKADTEKLIELLSLGVGNKFASQAINSILKERGIKK